MNNSTQKVIPHLWFDDQAEEAANFYTSLFENSKTGAITRYGKEGFEIHGQPEGKLMTIEFELARQKFIGLNGGPHFKFTPAISFIVNCETKEEVDEFWEELSEGGNTLMPLDSYPFSERYGWTEDKYGLSWQLILSNPEGDWRPKITPSLMFVGNNCGKAEEAIEFYTSMFSGSKIGNIFRYGPNQQPDKEGTIMYGDFTLEDQWLAAMDSAQKHNFTFNEAISLLINCEGQEEVDYFWSMLREGGDPKAQQCGWLKDEFGVSWQVSPTILHEMLLDPDPQKVARVTNAFLQMKKFDIQKLQEAYEG